MPATVKDGDSRGRGSNRPGSEGQRGGNHGARRERGGDHGARRELDVRKKGPRAWQPAVSSSKNQKQETLANEG